MLRYAITSSAVTPLGSFVSLADKFMKCEINNDLLNFGNKFGLLPKLSYLCSEI